MEQSKFKRAYIRKINAAIDYIEDNIYDELNLTTISNVSGFSPFHFHRIFKAHMGETINRFLQRIRLEKAATQLLHNHEKSITDIAFDCGFSGSAAFARLFKEKYGMSASEWQKKMLRKNGESLRKNCKSERNIGKENRLTFDYYNDSNTWRLTMKEKNSTTFEVKEMAAMTVAYVRHIGPYKGDSELFEQLYSKVTTWAGARDLLKFPETKFLTAYHDDPGITDEQQLRISVGLTVPSDVKTDGEIGKMEIPKRKYGIGHFELKADEFESAWTRIYRDWLPQSGYQPDEGACLEICLNDPKEHPEHKHIVDICIPVKPL